MSCAVGGIASVDVRRRFYAYSGDSHRVEWKSIVLTCQLRWFDYCCAVPQAPGPPHYVASTTDTLTVTWNQTGTADNYQVAVNNSNSYFVNFTGVGTSTVTAFIANLPVSGQSYCLTVIAVSHSLNSTSTEACNFVTGQSHFTAFS